MTRRRFERSGCDDFAAFEVANKSQRAKKRANDKKWRRFLGVGGVNFAKIDYNRQRVGADLRRLREKVDRAEREEPKFSNLGKEIK